MLHRQQRTSERDPLLLPANSTQLLTKARGWRKLCSSKAEEEGSPTALRWKLLSRGSFPLLKHIIRVRMDSRSNGKRKLLQSEEVATISVLVQLTDSKVNANTFFSPSS